MERVFITEKEKTELRNELFNKFKDPHSKPRNIWRNVIRYNKNFCEEHNIMPSSGCMYLLKSDLIKLKNSLHN